MPSRYEVYKIKEKTNLAEAALWNKIFEDIDLRIAKAEETVNRIDGAADQLIAVGLRRMNETFTPLILDAQQRLSSFGALFNAQSTTELTIGNGTKFVVLDAADRAGYVYTDYVTLRASGQTGKAMTGSVSGYDRETGTLTIVVVSTEGSGSYAAWDVRLGVPPDTTHAGRTDNPHSVTAAQVGAYTKGQVDSLIAGVQATVASDALRASNNLTDLLNPDQARISLGLGSAATKSAAFFQVAGDYATHATLVTMVSSRVSLAGNQKLSGGFWADSLAVGVVSSGTFTPDPAGGNIQHVTNNGAHTLAPPTKSTSMLLEYVNGASAGALSVSGFTKVSGTYSTAPGAKHQLIISKTNTVSTLIIQPI